MRKVFDLTPDQLHGVERGLGLRIAECVKLRAGAKSAAGQREWVEQMRSAETALAAVEKLSQV